MRISPNLCLCPWVLDWKGDLLCQKNKTNRTTKKKGSIQKWSRTHDDELISNLIWASISCHILAAVLSKPNQIWTLSFCPWPTTCLAHVDAQLSQWMLDCFLRGCSGPGAPTESAPMITSTDFLLFIVLLFLLKTLIGFDPGFNLLPYHTDFNSKCGLVVFAPCLFSSAWTTILIILKRIFLVAVKSQS